MSDPAEVEKQAQILFAQMTTSRGASFTTGNEPFGKAVIARLRELLSGQTIPPHYETPT